MSDIKITKLSKIISSDLKAKDKDSEKYWNKYSEIISEKLPYHQIDSPVIKQETRSDGSSISWMKDSQYLEAHNMKILTKNLLETQLKSLPATQPTSVEIDKETKKIRIEPNQVQKELFDKCFNAHRYFYNKAIEEMTNIYERNKNNKENKIEQYLESSQYHIVVAAVVIKNEDLTEENMWMKEIPICVRNQAVKTAVATKDTVAENFRNGNISHFKLDFLSKKRSINICFINKKSLTNGNLFPKILKEFASLLCQNCLDYRNNYKDDISIRDHCNIKSLENKSLSNNCKPCVDDIVHPKCKQQCKFLTKSYGDFSIIQEKDENYYACMIVSPTNKILDLKENICALDPGVRTFQTMYSKDSTAEFGYDTAEKILCLYKREDKLKAVLATATLTSKKRRGINKKCDKLRTKIKNITDDLHWKIADYLTKNFQVILLPVFNTNQTSSKNDKVTSNTATRLLIGLSHHEFQQKLLYKAKQRGRNVILCKEDFTTKCCGGCGTLNEKIGGKKTFHCENCSLTMDRDIHAARNILIRTLSTYFGNTLG
jgi:putative transposase